MANKEYFTITLFRHLGREAVLRLLEHIEHPQCDAIKQAMGELEDVNKTSDTALFRETIKPLLDAASDEQKQKDKRIFTRINELANPEGYTSMVAVCALVKEQVQDLPTQFETGEGLAIELYIHHPTVFDRAYTYNNAQHYQDGWCVKASKTIGKTYKWTPELEEAFKAKVLALFKMKHGCGDRINIDAYDDDPKYLILNICTQDRPRIQQDFTDAGEFKGVVTRPPVESMILYEKKTGVLRLRTTRKTKSVIESLSTHFVDIVIKNKEDYVATLESKKVTLNNLVQMSDLSVEGFKGLASATLVEVMVRRKHSKNGCLHVLKHNDGVLEQLADDYFKVPLYFYSAIVSFKVYDSESDKSDRGKTIRVKIDQMNHNVYTPANSTGHTINECIRSWGIVSV